MIETHAPDPCADTPGLHVKVRRIAQPQEIFAYRKFSVYMGPTFITAWVIRCTQAFGLTIHEAEYRLNDGGWVRLDELLEEEKTPHPQITSKGRPS